MTEATEMALDQLIRLLPQLKAEVYTKRQSDGPSGGKPKSQPPLNLQAFDLVNDVEWERDCHAVQVYHCCRTERLLVEVRRFLGYDKPVVQLQSTVCHVCGSALEVAADASTSVVCANMECGYEYKQEDWIDILYANSDAA